MRSCLILIILINFLPLINCNGETEKISESNIVYVLPIFSNINSTTWIHTQRAFEEAQARKAAIMILHINTYGGEVVFADSMRTKILNSSIPVYVFIDNNAASAGALISIACKKIFMRPGANIGAATVVNQTGEEMPDKYQSYMRATIRATAEAHGKDTMIVGGDTIVKWIRDPQIAEAMVDERVIIPGVSEAGQVLTFTALEAIEHRYCEGLANNINEIIQTLEIENPEVITFKPTVYDGIKGFLTSPFLRGLLILLIIGGIYFEMQSPGVGFPLVVSICAAVLYFAPLYIDGLAEHWEIILFVIGVLLIILEIFVFPGFGFVGVLGIILAITGLTLSLIQNVVFDFSNVDGAEIITALATVIIGMAGAFVLSILLSKSVLTQKKGIFSKVALHTGQEVVEGYIGVDIYMSKLVGRYATTSTILRPSGKIIIDNELYDACSIDGFINKDEEVKVTDFSTGQLYVKKP